MRERKVVVLVDRLVGVGLAVAAVVAVAVGLQAVVVAVVAVVAPFGCLVVVSCAQCK